MWISSPAMSIALLEMWRAIRVRIIFGVCAIPGWWTRCLSGGLMRSCSLATVFFSHGRLIASRRLRHIPFLFRGDSHLLAEKLNFLSRAGKRIALRILFRRFSAFLSVGRANAEYFRRHGVSEDKIFFAPHAVDQERFRAEPAQTERDARAWRDELKIPESHRVILFVGKFERKKSPEDLVRAFFAAALPETTLLLVGSGSLEEALRRMAENHPAIRVAPFQNQSAMPRTYAAANVVVLPSAGPGETWGLAIHEALVCGKPVIVSDHVGCHSDLVQAGRNGFIFPAGETDALRKVLVEAMSDPGRLERWGKAGEEIADGFSYREATAGLERALAMILSGVPAS